MNWPEKTATSSSKGTCPRGKSSQIPFVTSSLMTFSALLASGPGLHIPQAGSRSWWICEVKIYWRLSIHWSFIATVNIVPELLNTMPRAWNLLARALFGSISEFTISEIWNNNDFLRMDPWPLRHTCALFGHTLIRELIRYHSDSICY